MPGEWRTSVKLKHLFKATDDPDELIECMGEIKEAVESSAVFKHFDIELFDQVKKEEVLGMDTEDQCNHVLNKLYDYADRNRIWIK